MPTWETIEEHEDDANIDNEEVIDQDGADEQEDEKAESTEDNLGEVDENEQEDGVDDEVDERVDGESDEVDVEDDDIVDIGDSTDDSEDEPSSIAEQQEFEITIGDEKLNATSAAERIGKLSGDSKSLEEIKNDPFLGKFIEHYQNGGNPLDYLQANTSLEDSMSPIDLLKSQFMKDNSDVSEATASRLWNKELKERYKIGVDPDIDGLTVDDLEDGKAMMERDAARARRLIKDEKSKFKIAKREDFVDEKLINERLEQSKQEAVKEFEASVKEWQEMIDTHEATKFLKEKGMVKIVNGDKTMGYRVENPNSIIEMAKDNRKIIEKISDKNGTDVGKLTKLAAFADNMEKYDQTLIKYGMKMAEKNMAMSERNIKSPNRTTTKIAQKNDSKTNTANALRAVRTIGWQSASGIR